MSRLLKKSRSLVVSHLCNSQWHLHQAEERDKQETATDIKASRLQTTISILASFIAPGWLGPLPVSLPMISSFLHHVPMMFYPRRAPSLYKANHQNHHVMLQVTYLKQAKHQAGSLVLQIKFHHFVSCQLLELLSTMIHLVLGNSCSSSPPHQIHLFVSGQFISTNTNHPRKNHCLISHS